MTRPYRLTCGMTPSAAAAASSARFAAAETSETCPGTTWSDEELDTELDREEEAELAGDVSVLFTPDNGELGEEVEGPETLRSIEAVVGTPATSVPFDAFRSCCCCKRTADFAFPAGFSSLLPGIVLPLSFFLLL